MPCNNLVRNMCVHLHKWKTWLEGMVFHRHKRKMAVYNAFLRVKLWITMWIVWKCRLGQHFCFHHYIQRKHIRHIQCIPSAAYAFAVKKARSTRHFAKGGKRPMLHATVAYAALRMFMRT